MAIRGRPSRRIDRTRPSWQGAVELDVNVDDDWETIPAEVTENGKQLPWFPIAITGIAALIAIPIGIYLAPFFFDAIASRRVIQEPEGPPARSETPVRKTGPRGNEPRPKRGPESPRNSSPVATTSPPVHAAVVSFPKPLQRRPCHSSRSEFIRQSGR